MRHPLQSPAGEARYVLRNDGQQENRGLSATVSLFALKAGLLLGVVVGSVGLSACGGGGGPSSPSTPSGGSAREIVITPLANRAPIAVESIPVQTLTTGANVRIVDVATYFMDPDNDQLTYSAVSDRQDILEASMSDSMMTLTPVSAGTATVTVTASDGYADAIQTINTVVQEPETRQTSVQKSETRQTPVQKSEIELTDVVFNVDSSTKPRRTYLSVSPVPANAELSSFGFSNDPVTAGRIFFAGSYGEITYFKFRCTEGYNGDVIITFSLSRSPIEKSVSVTCR